MVWLLWMIGLALLAAIVLSSWIRFRFQLIRETDNDHLALEFRALFGIIKYKYEIPYVNFNGLWEGFTLKSEESNVNQGNLLKDGRIHWSLDTLIAEIKKLRRLIEHVLGFSDWLSGTLSHVQCTEIQWSTRIGIGDAADTAISAGVLWGLKTSVLNAIFRQIRLVAKPRLAVEPQYNHNLFSTSFLFKTQTRLGYTLFAGMLFIIRILRVKGGLKTWQNALFKT